MNVSLVRMGLRVSGSGLRVHGSEFSRMAKRETTSPQSVIKKLFRSWICNGVRRFSDDLR
jgi:hypothetical protein